MSDKDDSDDEIEEELKKEREQSEKRKKEQVKEVQKKDNDKLQKIREEKERLQSIMDERKGKAPEKKPKPIETKEEKLEKPKKQKEKEVKSADEITDKEKKTAEFRNKISWANIKKTLKETLTPDNILKYKAFIILMMMLVIPGITYVAASEARANKLAEEQSPQLYHFSSQYGEVLFEIDMRNPMARDSNDTIYRSFDYSISFSQDPDTEYLLPLDQYSMNITALTFKFSFRNSTQYASWVSNVEVITETYTNGHVLNIGDSLTQTKAISQDVFGDHLPVSENWSMFTVSFKVNATFYFDPEVEQEIAISFQGTIVDIGMLKELNMPAARTYALMVTVIYLFIAGFATLAFILFLRKKKYSYIKPY